MRREPPIQIPARAALPPLPRAASVGIPAVSVLGTAIGERRGVLLRRAAATVAAVLLVLALALGITRATHHDRIYPAVAVADVQVGGLSREEAAAAVRDRAAQIGATPVTFTYGGRTFQAPLSEIGVSVDGSEVLDEAWAVGREPSAAGRLRSSLGMFRGNENVELPLALDEAKLAAWFDRIDGELGLEPGNAALAINGSTVDIVPERAGVIVDRQAATAALVSGLAMLQPPAGELPVASRPAGVTAADLGLAREKLAMAMAMPIQVSWGGGLWTLPPAEVAKHLVQQTDPARTGADAFTMRLDQPALAGWLATTLGPEIARDPKDAKVGWNGEKLVSVTPSQDGVTLDAPALAAAVEQSFFGNHAAVTAPVILEKPTIDSNNLQALGITNLLGSGQSNYSGSSDGRSTNVEVGAQLLNGTLIPPGGEFSFNRSIGFIDESVGFVEAQVIAGEKIGKDVGGGICQISTTTFRAAYYAGMPITEWWPHRFRIAFYEYDGSPPGLDASILQPSEDPATWGDFKFENPTDSWLLVESWTDGENVFVNLYGPDTGYVVETTGPKMGQKFQALPDEEIVDPELDPWTMEVLQSAGVGQEMSHYRRVLDRDGNVLWEGNFATKFYPRGNIWKVSPDMKGQSPADPKRKMDPLVQADPDPLPTRRFKGGTLVSTDLWTAPAPEAEQTSSGGWTDPDTGEWVEPGQDGATPPDSGSWVDPNTGDWTDGSGGWTDPATGEWVEPNA